MPIAGDRAGCVSIEIEVARFQPDLLADIAEPRFAELPCLPYRLEPQPAFVTESAPWACVR